jgi:hypothetical protein
MEAVTKCCEEGAALTYLGQVGSLKGFGFLASWAFTIGPLGSRLRRLPSSALTFLASTGHASPVVGKRRSRGGPTGLDGYPPPLGNDQWALACRQAPYQKKHSSGAPPSLSVLFASRCNSGFGGRPPSSSSVADSTTPSGVHIAANRMSYMLHPTPLYPGQPFQAFSKFRGTTRWHCILSWILWLSSFQVPRGRLLTASAGSRFLAGSQNRTSQSDGPLTSPRARGDGTLN